VTRGCELLRGVRGRVAGAQGFRGRSRTAGVARYSAKGRFLSSEAVGSRAYPPCINNAPILRMLPARMPF